MRRLSTVASYAIDSKELVFMAALLFGGCGGSTDQGPDAGSESDADVAEGDSGDVESGSPGCTDSKVSVGDTSATLQFGGKSRPYVLHVPSGYKQGEPTPLVINMHGFLSNYTEQVALTRMSALADTEGFIVAYPNGGGDPPAWNAGDCCEFSDTKRDDVGLISALIDAIAADACIDPARVYATGYSNGGFMAHELACKLSDKIAAIATVAGVLGIPPETCKPGRALPVLQIHGDADPTVPYAGGSPTGWTLLYPDQAAPIFRSAAETADFWRKQSSCKESTTAGFTMGDAACKSYDGCQHDSEVTLCTISGGGHTWPGGDPAAFQGSVMGLPVSAFLGKTSTALDASQQIWDFFKRHPLP